MQIRCTQADHRNQQIMGFCIDSICQDQRPYCNFCLPRHGQHLKKLISVELLNEWIQQRIFRVQNVQQNIQECKLSLDNLLKFLIPYFNFDTQQFPDIGISQIDNMIKSLCQLESCEELLFKQLKQSIEQTQFIIDETLKKERNLKNQKQQFKFQIPNSDPKILILAQQQHLNISKANQNYITFELMNQSSIPQEDKCYAIAIRKDNSIVLAGFGKDIKVFRHEKGLLNQIQLLSEHKNDVLTLNFMKKTNNFASGSFDNLIIIWQETEYYKWDCLQKLNGHSSRIFCLLLNNIDDLIISGSYDKTIKFWKKQNQ
ncbi:unnamed protein product [Paramecium pentaurelia]|uniref:Uncharacterized protein n=1 Tax=Paramecium pentaurelia TaxID=43138 RepID=A0A8S1XMW8_9CILI|nr:unnamed protein product [Paramecium pentaurelia]